MNLIRLFLVLKIVIAVKGCGLIRDRSQSPENYLKQVAWNYKNMAAWGRWFPQCNGQSQSPIDLSQAEKQKAYVDIRLDHNYRSPLMFELMNNGYTAELMVRDEEEFGDSRPLLRLGSEQFRFEQLHFHWGHDDHNGTEHALHGKRFAMEMHLVHSNVRFANFTAALGQRTGIVVLSVLYHKSKHSALTLGRITSQLSQVKKAGQVVNLKMPITLSSLIKHNLDRVLVYSGSLTTPPCTELVSWLVSPVLGKITESQLDQFRALRDLEGNQLKSNVRNLQAVNGRIVWESCRRR
ncbi:Carbonic anhydrase 15 [Halotydeus destructor]|nr:Carbonic anhydrase 15 [Halotydeus destructor]